jgi:hypothetical protein
VPAAKAAKARQDNRSTGCGRGVQGLGETGCSKWKHRVWAWGPSFGRNRILQMAAPGVGVGCNDWAKLHAGKTSIRCGCRAETGRTGCSRTEC